MTEINLKTNNEEQELILSYLQDNASETLAEKINNGVTIQKDGKTVINRKTLDGFMNYANNEAKNLAAKGASALFVKNETVYGWAIHYFEEDSIEGTLYNEDGSEYKPSVKTSPKSDVKPVVKPVEEPTNKQISLFDLFDTSKKEPQQEEITEEISEKEVREQLPNEMPKAKVGTPFYPEYMKVQNKYPNSVIAYRLGDFYEILGDNAIELAEEIDLTLTGRDCGLDERVSLIGFPYHTAELYFNKISLLHDLVIAEDTDNVRCLQKRKIIDKETGVVTDCSPTNDITNKLSKILNTKIIVR